MNPWMDTPSGKQFRITCSCLRTHSCRAHGLHFSTETWRLLVVILITRRCGDHASKPLAGGGWVTKRTLALDGNLDLNLQSVLQIRQVPPAQTKLSSPKQTENW